MAKGQPPELVEIIMSERRVEMDCTVYCPPAEKLLEALPTRQNSTEILGCQL
jgi:hypothetical protein